MKKAFYFIIFLLLFCACKKSKTSEQEVALPKESIYRYGLDITDLRCDTFAVQSGDNLSLMLKNMGADNRQVAFVNSLPDSILNPRKIIIGDNYLAYYQNDTVLSAFVYLKSKLRYSVVCLADSLYAYNGVIPTYSVTKTAQISIGSSLWAAVEQANLSMDIFVKLSDIYAWTVDFFALQKGDIFKIYYDEIYADSTFICIDKIWAAQYYDGKRTNNAYFYNDKYWNEAGESMKKAFLKAPLNFSRISSKFSYARKHPVYKVVRPHTGVDYAAPKGTPVVSIGDGTVIECGYKGGGGNTVKIRHNGEYTTAYLHLSRYGNGIKVGTKVTQGQVIGYVGSTGTSTGPHLDFRVWKNGTPIDPLKMESPSADPLEEQYKADFEKVVNKYKAVIDTIK